MSTQGTRPSRAVFVRRRVLALVLLAALVTGLVLLGRVVVRAVQPMVGADDVSTGRAAPPTPEPLGPPRDCGAGALELTLAPSDPEFTVDEAVELHVTMRHVGARPCLVDGSDAGRPVLVRAGDEVVWSSAHCATQERPLLMSRGDEVSATVRWDRRRSVEGCAPDQPEAGYGTFTAVVGLAGVDGATSAPATFTVLDPNPPAPPAEPAEPAEPGGTEGGPAETTEEPAQGADGSGDQPPAQPEQTGEPAAPAETPAEPSAPPAEG
ncbi:hypothetical protein [Cellulosimicrobium sp. CUA-896]|uniref:hypothetical protein n=1 Tax=Cellulosimicrobium sp. CUA-896 TaxID=1517881 RepID=UPI00095D38DB|nr:hypothetical protein [Cellulosimicrobium sp. CUA-896]OLT54243.1 hypothetical protein BJF88_09880 [Cellulosimicrobium sp. CUA-896]